MRAIFFITLKRLRAQLGLSLALLMGLTVAIGLMVTVPTYADAITFSLLEERLAQVEKNRSRPPYTFLYLFIGSWHGPIDWEDAQPITEYIDAQADHTLNLPVEEIVFQVQTDFFKLFPENTQNYSSIAEPLMSANFGYARNLDHHLTIVEGDWPQNTNGNSIEILVALPIAEQTGFQVGDRFQAFNPRSPADSRQSFTVEISGIWEPTDPDGNLWFYSVDQFETVIWISEESYANVLSPALEDEIYRAAWYLVMDGSGITTRSIDHLIGGEQALTQALNQRLANTKLMNSLGQELNSYRQDAAQLTTQLLLFNLPAVVLVLAFIWLVAGLMVGQQRNEIAINRSRGGRPWQILGLATWQGIILGSIAFVLGSILALLLVRQMGAIRSFLDFSGSGSLRATMSPTGWFVGFGAVIIAVIAQIIPTFSAAAHTIISYKQDQARKLVPPWWQRVWLDTALIVVALYGTWQLSWSDGDLAADSLFENPLLLLLPSLFIFAITLFFLRILQPIMEWLSNILMRTNSVALLQATRNLARSPSQSAAPLILLTLTISLSVFTASLARTLDLQLYDQHYYATGSELSLSTNYFYLGSSQSAGSDGEEYFLPVATYEEISGVDTATRITRFPVKAGIGGSELSGSFFGLDWQSFDEVGYWRDDFSQYRIGSLMNALGNHPEGVLVPRHQLATLGVRVGDLIRLTVNAEGLVIEADMQIVGTFDQFPTWYEEKEDTLIVGNIETLFELAGGELPFQVWLDIDQGNFGEEEFQQALEQRRLFSTTWEIPEDGVNRGLADPARRGIFGLLSVGFIASALLTVVGFFLYAIFSLRQRTIEIGILQAVGLPTRSMVSLIGWELALLILFGTGLGTMLGVGVSRFFIPFFQIGRQSIEQTPPFLVEISWPAVFQIYGLFSLLFFAALISLSIVVHRMELFQAIKMGETV